MIDATEVSAISYSSMQPSPKEKSLILGLHFLPGVIFSAVLFLIIPRIQGMVADLFLTQVIFVTVCLLGLELVIAEIYCRVFESKGIWAALRISGAIRFDWKALGYAVAWAAMSVAIMKGYLYLANPFIQKFRAIPLLQLPSWHFQNLEMPSYPPIFKTALLAFMLVSNVFAEEIYFRGFLLERLKFLGRVAFIVNGLFFIGYHIFQIPIAYPLFPFGLLLSGYYAKFRNVWGCMLIHLILNLSL